jgi:hypothetical protein
MRREKNVLIIGWKRNACRLVVGTTKGTSLLGMYKGRWDDNIKTVLKEKICYSFLSVRSKYNFQNPFLEILNLRYFLM